MGLNTRLLAVIIEMMYIPFPIEDKTVRGLFERLGEEHGIKTYQTKSDGAYIMSSGEERSNMISYRVLKDRLFIAYEFCKNSMNFYSGLTGDVIDKFCEETDLKLFIASNVTIRKNANVEGVKDSRDYLIKKVFSLDDSKLKPFKRPLHMIGNRIFFPAIKGKEQVSYDMKIESSLENYNNLFIENKGMFTSPVERKNAAVEAVKNVKKTEDFIDKNITEFIMQFNKEG